MKNKHFKIIARHGSYHDIPYLHKFKYCGHVFAVHRAVVGCGHRDLKLSKNLYSISHYKTGGGIELKHTCIWMLKDKVKLRISSKLSEFEYITDAFPIINK